MKKHVLITGVSSGIGKYVAEQYIASECKVIGLDKDITNINHASFEFKQLDLKDEKATLKAFQSIDKIDIAINCAGVSAERKPIVDFSASELINNIELNLLPMFNALRAELKIMQKQKYGNIVNIASITGHIGMKSFASYSSAKAAIINLSKVAAIENSDFNIRVNSISPATIDTPMIRKKYNEKLKDYGNIYYTKNCGHSEDIFSVIKMLENNNFATGSDIKVDGGLTDLFVV